MASPRQAIAQLRDAIGTIRAACGADPGCRHLLRLLSDVEQALHEVSYAQPLLPNGKDQVTSALARAKDAVDQAFGESDSDADDSPPSNLKDAAVLTARSFADRRMAKKRYDT